MLKEEVSEEDIAAVVAKWTGIPVDRLLAGAKEKLVHADEELNARRLSLRERKGPPERFQRAAANP
jgi:ATP-dependent Clp protease ATP-binding subunit ClpB